MIPNFKTAKFGGYDKVAVEEYIEGMQADHNKEVEDLKANIVKLSETVKNLHTMREVNQSESSSTIDNLKSVNEDLLVEVNQLREQLNAFKTRETESASRYESISRTLLEARENADQMIRETDAQCDAKKQATEEQCDKLMNDTIAEIDRLRSENIDECERRTRDTDYYCEQEREKANNECAELRRATTEATDNLKYETENYCKELTETTERECEELKATTTTECEEQRSKANIEVYNYRMSVKNEIEITKGYMEDLIKSLENVNSACTQAREVAANVFPDLR